MLYTPGKKPPCQHIVGDFKSVQTRVWVLISLKSRTREWGFIWATHCNYKALRIRPASWYGKRAWGNMGQHQMMDVRLKINGLARTNTVPGSDGPSGTFFKHKSQNWYWYPFPYPYPFPHLYPYIDLNLDLDLDLDLHQVREDTWMLIKYLIEWILYYKQKL